MRARTQLLVGEVPRRMGELLSAPQTRAAVVTVLEALDKAGDEGLTTRQVKALGGWSLFALALLGMVDIVERIGRERVRLAPYRELALATVEHGSIM